MKKIVGLCLSILISVSAAAQIKWYNPVQTGFATIQSQGWPCMVRENPYQRFPDAAQASVRPVVWRLSRHCAGESIEFTTNASEIIVRYTLAGGKAMPHMPATGVSGVDLYSKDRHGNEIWIGGKYSFSDTVSYRFGTLTFDGGEKRQHTYTLFLPLYNTVTWMEIGVDEKSCFRFEPQKADAPIVAYGTSIGQGACASRPGMAWTNILQRRLDRPVINLGFSGNAFFEKEVIELLAQIDAKAYILDALPNSHTMSYQQLKDTIMAAVKRIRRTRPDTPILLVDHLGYPHGKAIEYWNKQQNHANHTQEEAYKRLLYDGVKNIYYLSYDEIAMPQDATVEGIHTSDYGMKVYADAYEKKLREILDEPIGKYTTMRPVTQSRDSYDWNARHRNLLLQTRGKHYHSVIIGNSIIHQWGGVEDFAVQRGTEVWNRELPEALNLGYGWDKIENVLWRIYHGEIDSLTADRIVLMIGTNNLSAGDSDEAIVAGIARLITAIGDRRPEAELKLIGILPRRDMEQRIARLNKKLAGTAARLKVEYADPGRKLIGKGGKIDESLFVDGLHPSAEGYEKIAQDFAD